MLDASRRAGVKQFVHLSSVAAYGDPAGPTLDEAAPATPAPNSYGWTKHAQDEIVKRAADRGQSCVVLCPPNISGSYSAFLMEVLQSIRRGELALVDGGRSPIELVDVTNLVHAIWLALDVAPSDGRRIFVTDGSDVTWGDLANMLAPLADRHVPVPTMLGDEARALCVDVSPPSVTLRGTLKHLCSPDMRSTLRKDPLIAAAEKSVKGAIKRLPALERALRRRFEERVVVKRVRRAPLYSERLIRQQLRNIRYSQSRARAVLGYEPLVSAEQSLFAFRAWYRELYGWGDSVWALTRHLQS
jgi:nucleoside-diphosphate-sugar epimerase